MFKKTLVIVSGIVLMAALLAVQAFAAQTAPPDAADITTVNNLTGTPDTVTIDNVQVNDTIRVYSAASGGVPVGVMIADGGPSTMVSINQLGTGAGSAYVTVTSSSSSESDRTPVPYGAEPKTAPPDASDITVNNFAAGRPDLIVVLNLSAGDIVRVYPNSVSTVALAAAVNPSGGWLFVNQLGVAAGSVFVTVQSTGELESGRTQVSYLSETTVGPADGDVTVVNNHYTETGGIQDAGTEDTVTVSGAAADDIITIYKSSIGPDTWLPPMTVTPADIDAMTGDVSLTIGQLGEKAGKIYVTITSVTKAESKRKTVPYTAEPVADTPVLADVTVTNNYIIGDTVRITGLIAGDLVSVYATPVGLATIGSNTVGPAGTEVTVPINPGLLSAAGGKLYVTVTSATANESSRLAVPYSAEDVTDGVSLSQVTITNNYSISDIVNVKGLMAGDLVKVYSTPAGATLIGSDTAAVDQVTIPLNPGTLLTKGGNIYITVTSATANESKRTAVPYKSEPVTTIPVAATITVVNNYSASDAVIVPGRTAGDVVRVYLTPTGATLIPSATESGGTATVSIDAGVLSATGGKVYVTVTSQIANESTRVMVSYLKEATTDPPLKENITVTNNYLIDDTIDVVGLTAGDVVKIYASLTGAAPIKSAVSGGASHTFTLDPNTLSAAGGKIYVSVKMNTANESPRTAITYGSEKSTAPIAKDVVVTNNFYTEDAGGAQIPASYDSVLVPGVKLGDIITIYKASGGTATWVSPVTVTAGNLSGGSVAIPVSQLGTNSGKLFVTVTELNRSESVRTGVTFLSEPTTTAPLAASIVITNNSAAEDTVTINNLTASQVVTIYTAATGTTVLDTAPAGGISKTFTLDDGILASGGGKLYITVRDTDKLESLRTAQIYTSETTASPIASKILVVNYAGTAYDTVTITGLTPGDIVRIYTLPAGGTAQTTATVAVKGWTFTLDANLADTAGTIYVTVTNDGKAESKRVAVNYDAA